MRILLVNYRYFVSGGPEIYMFHIKEKFEEEGHEVIPFSIHSNKNVNTGYSKYFIEPIGSRDSTYFDECRKTPRVILQMISRSIYSFKVKNAIKKIIKDTKPDLMYVIHYINKLSPSVIRGAKEMGLPVVLRLSDYFLLCPRFDFLYQRKICEECLTKGYRSCIKKRCVKDSLFASVIRVLSMKIHKLIRIYDDIDVFISPSEFLKEKLTVYGFDTEKIQCIPTFTTGNSKDDKPPTGSYGLYIGRITEEKGVDTLVYAYEKLPKDYRLIIAGDDKTGLGIKLKTYIQNKNLTNIEFTGFKTGAELEDIIKNARFTFIPSIWYDNLPNAALEAFRYYKPVLASNIGSLPELVIDGYNGYLFEPGNADEIVRLVKKMDDGKLVETMGIHSRKIMQEKFSADTHYHKLMNIFQTLVSDKSK